MSVANIQQSNKLSASVTVVMLVRALTFICNSDRTFKRKLKQPPIHLEISLDDRLDLCSGVFLTVSEQVGQINTPPSSAGGAIGNTG